MDAGAAMVDRGGGPVNHGGVRFAFCNMMSVAAVSGCAASGLRIVNSRSRSSSAAQPRVMYFHSPGFELRSMAEK
jgi:hypothetical protein